MKFTKDSENYMSFFMPYFKKHLNKKNAAQQRGFDKLMKQFYEEIKISEKKTDKLFMENKVKINITEVNNFKSVEHSSLLDSVYIPVEAKTYIENNLVGLVEYSAVINKRKVKINFYLLLNKHFNELKKLEVLAYRMFSWLHFISLYANKKCARFLNTYVYLTPLKKILPNNQYTILSAINANTGVTTSCATNGEICLFREEELFKVFIHESIHALGLDFSGMSNVILNKKIKKIFPINSKFNLYEAYTEFWANILNCTFTAYYLSEGVVDDFLIYSEFCIAFEEYFSLFQCVKVLKFMGLYYNYLFVDSDLAIRARKYLFKENTNIFAYYIIKAILMFNSYYFMMWCKRNNTNIINFDKNRVNLNKFFTFILNHYKEPKFLKAIEDVNDQYIEIRSKNKKFKNEALMNMRMSIVELV
jgi:hypothetical protein